MNQVCGCPCAHVVTTVNVRLVVCMLVDGAEHRSIQHNTVESIGISLVVDVRGVVDKRECIGEGIHLATRRLGGGGEESFAVGVV